MSGSSRRSATPPRRRRSSTTSPTRPTPSTCRGWGTRRLPKFNWASEKLRERFIDGPDSVVATWLKPPYNADGWRIDVANMTGRLGDIDHNADVRQLLRKTMIDINPETVLLGESTNDATGDLQGDGWHGAMTYASFTRPLWGWLSEPADAAYLTAEGDELVEPWFFGQPIGGIPRYTARSSPPP